MNKFFSSGTSALLLNCVPRKTFTCKRGVRQGDPSHTLFFVLAADFLQYLINKGKDLGLLKLPIPLKSFSNFPVIQYAYDALVITERDDRQLIFEICT